MTQANELAKALIIKEQSLREERAKTTALERDLRDLKIELKQARLSPRSTIVPDGISPKITKGITLLQAAVRGFVYRMKSQRARIHHMALSAGVLFAMKNTIQGTVYIWHELMNSMSTLTIIICLVRRGEWMVLRSRWLHLLLCSRRGVLCNLYR